MVLLELRTDVERGDGSGDYAFFELTEVTLCKDMVYKRLGCARLRCDTDGNVDHSFGRDTPASERGHISIEKQFWMEMVQTLNGCMNMVRDDHATELFLERILWPTKRSM